MAKLHNSVPTLMKMLTADAEVARESGSMNPSGRPGPELLLLSESDIKLVHVAFACDAKRSMYCDCVSVADAVRTQYTLVAL